MVSQPANQLITIYLDPLLTSIGEDVAGPSVATAAPSVAVAAQEETKG